MQIASAAMHAEWTVIFTDDPDRHERVICFAIRDSDKTVIPLIHDEETGLILDPGEIGAYTLA